MTRSPDRPRGSTLCVPRLAAGAALMPARGYSLPPRFPRSAATRAQQTVIPGGRLGRSVAGHFQIAKVEIRRGRQRVPGVGEDRFAQCVAGQSARGSWFARLAASRPAWTGAVPEHPVAIRGPADRPRRGARPARVDCPRTAWHCVLWPGPARGRPRTPEFSRAGQAFDQVALAVPRREPHTRQPAGSGPVPALAVHPQRALGYLSPAAAWPTSARARQATRYPASTPANRYTGLAESAPWLPWLARTPGDTARRRGTVDRAGLARPSSRIRSPSNGFASAARRMRVRTRASPSCAAAAVCGVTPPANHATVARQRLVPLAKPFLRKGDTILEDIVVGIRVPPYACPCKWVGQDRNALTNELIRLLPIGPIHMPVRGHVDHRVFDRSAPPRLGRSTSPQTARLDTQIARPRRAARVAAGKAMATGDP